MTRRYNLEHGTEEQLGIITIIDNKRKIAVARSSAESLGVILKLIDYANKGYVTSFN